MKKMVWLGIIMLVLITGMIVVLVNYMDNDRVKYQVIKFDIMDDGEKVVKEAEIQVNDVIKLKKYRGNDIKILEINDENIKISRDARRYEIVKEQTATSFGEAEEYIVTLLETVKYDTLISIDMDSANPFGPRGQARYYYKIKFIK